MKTIITLFLILPCVAFSQTITGVTGDITSGESITISGSSFGTKTPAAPYLWDNFESGINGNAVGTGLSGLYTSYANVNYSNTSPFSGNLSAHSVVTSTSALPGLVASYAPSEATTAFLSMKWKIRSDYGSLAPHNIKLIRLNSDDPDPTHGFPNYNTGNDRTLLTFNQIVNHGSGNQDYVGGFGVSDYTYNGWNSIAIWGDLGDVDTANGMAGSEVNGVVYQESNITTLLSGAAGYNSGYRSFYMCGFLSHDGYDADLYLDNIYADRTLARVVLCENNTWADQGNNEMQIPSAWSATEITVTVNTGLFREGDDAWLFVIDSNGSVSDGEAVTIGESGGGSTGLNGCGTITATKAGN